MKGEKNMNKLLQKVAKLTLGLAMAAGVGVAIGAGHKDTAKVFATSGTMISSFSATSGDYDDNITYTSYKGGGTSNPQVNSNQIRLYQGTTTNAGGMLVIEAKTGYTISAITVGSGMATTLGYKVGTKYTTSTGVSNFTNWGSCSNGGTKELTGLSTTVVTFACLGTSSSSRWYVNKLSVTYSGGATDSVTVTLNTNSLNIDLYTSTTASLTATATTSGSATAGLTAVSSNTSVATVSTGTPTSGTAFTITGVSVGSATITVTSTWDDNKTATCTVNVTDSTPAPFDSKDFVQCTSTSDLEANATYIITNGTSGSVATMSTETNTNNRRSTTVSVSNNKIASTSATLTLTLGGSTGAWTFHTENYTGTDGYLTPGSTTSNARLNVSANNDNYGLYTISFSSGKAVITSTGKSSYHIMRCNPNSGSPLFACYSSGQNDIYLWKEYSTKTLSSLSVTGTPTKLSGYYDTDTFDPTGITAYTANYDDESTKSLSASDITWPALVANMGTIKGSYTENDVTVYTPTYNISVSADSLSTVSLSGTMTASYNTNDSWDKGSLVVTAGYLSGKTDTVTGDSTIAYYSDQAMTQEVATPADLGVGNNKTVYVKATYSGVSNATGYSQTVSITKAPTEQTKTINLVNCSLNDTCDASASSVTLATGVATMSWVKGSSTSNANNYMGGTGTYTHTRIYNGMTVTISANSNVLKEVLFSVNTPSNINVTITGGTYSSPESGIAKITANANVTSISFTLSSNTQFTSAEIHYYAPDVAATGITINGETSSSVSITPYQTTRLVASVLPVDATDRSFTFSIAPSDANAIITIDENGNVEPIANKYGDTVVTATSTDGGFTATCTVTVVRVSYHQAVYDPTSTSSVSTSGTLPQGSSASFETDRFVGGVVQMISGESMTLTLSGYVGQKIRSVILKMHSNQTGGAGSLTVTGGSTTIASISSATFADNSWNGEYTTEWVLIEPEATMYDVRNGENVVISIAASANSLFVDEIRVQYEASEIDTSAVDFAQMILELITCDNSGMTPPSSSDWLDLEGYWDDGSTITSAGKLVLLEADAVENEDPETDEEIIGAAMAKYDYIIGKYNKGLGLEDEYPDFIDRNPPTIGGQRIGLLPLTNSNNANTVAIIVIISLVSVTAIGGYFFLRKRKENI
jgi:hypothetical protein